MLAKRIIPCLDVDRGRVVKGTRFVALRDAGDPIALASRYDSDGADELVFLDITASAERRRTVVELAARVAERLTIPFCVGGGIDGVDVELFAGTGADAALAASIFHDGVVSVPALKAALASAGVEIRPATEAAWR